MVSLHSGVFKRSQDVTFFKKGVVLQNFLMGRPRAEASPKYR